MLPSPGESQKTGALLSHAPFSIRRSTIPEVVTQ